MMMLMIHAFAEAKNVAKMMHKTKAFFFGFWGPWFEPSGIS
jgi:hypothetical protein